MSKKLLKEKVEKALMIAPFWSGQPWFPLLLEMCIDHPVLLPKTTHLLTDTNGLPHPLMENGSLKLGAFLVSVNLSKQRDYQAGLPLFLWNPDVKVQPRLTHITGRNGVAGVVKGKRVPLVAV